MSDMIELHALFVSAFTLSLAYCAPPGPVTTEALRRGLRGYPAVLLFELGALVGGAAWAALGLAGAGALSAMLLPRMLLAITGALLMLRLAVRALTETRRGRLPDVVGCASSGDFGSGVVIALANPFAVVFWLGAAGGLNPTRVGQLGSVELAVVVSGFVLGNLAYRVGLAALISWGRRFLSATTFRYLNLISAVLLVFFSLQLVMSTLALVRG
jgi:threonine/homoserine/homoserine lactone efflux protein